MTQPGSSWPRAADDAGMTESGFDVEFPSISSSTAPTTDHRRTFSSIFAGPTGPGNTAVAPTEGESSLALKNEVQGPQTCDKCGLVVADESSLRYVASSAGC